VRRTKITSANWFNPDRSGFYRQLGLEETFSFQDGIDLLCERCPNLRRVICCTVLWKNFVISVSIQEID
jgi:hypothetical protein